MDKHLLAGKVVLVTGASSGIGAAAARVFAQEGAAVLLVARRQERLAALTDELRAAGARAAYTVADVTSPEEAALAVKSAVSTFGRLDGAFNNAGVGGDRTPLHQMDDETYDAIMDTNVRGVFNCLRAEIAAMLEHGGAIVNNSSVGGLVAIPAAAPYVASKHAVVGLTRAAADEYAQRGIRVNAVAPGTTRSEITTDWFARNPGLEDMVNSMTPQGRTAEPEEIAAARGLAAQRPLSLSDRHGPAGGRRLRQPVSTGTAGDYSAVTAAVRPPDRFASHARGV